MQDDRRSVRMRLALKCNVGFLTILMLVSAGVYLAGRNELQSRARGQVVEQARLMMDTTASIRKYTSAHIRPILDKYQHNSAAFYPESVPAFSAGRMFDYLRVSYPNYTYREATLNPTNPADRAEAWEADIVRLFQRNPGQREISGQHDSSNGLVLYLARPIQAVESCMECHSTPGAAPVSMVSLYGKDNGFGWILNDIIGAQIVSVPVSIPQALAAQARAGLLLSISGFALLILALLNGLLYLIVIRRLRLISAAAAELSTGNLNVTPIPVTGGDEMARLADSLNRINRSLVKAIGMLGR